MDLSKFFTLEELTRSDTAEREGIPNDPDPGALEHLRALCATLLDPLREAIGRPIRVNSGYRGPALNARIGGAKKSQHLEGKAADIQSPGMSVLDLFKTIIRLNLPFDQLIYEAQSRTVKWVHISFDPARDRRQIMTAEFGPNGKVLRYPVISAQDALALSDPPTRAPMPAVWGYSELADEPAQLGERTIEKKATRKSAKTTAPKPRAKRARVRARTKASTSAKSSRARTTKPRSVKTKSSRRGRRRRAS